MGCDPVCSEQALRTAPNLETVTGDTSTERSACPAQVRCGDALPERRAGVSSTSRVLLRGRSQVGLLVAGVPRTPGLPPAKIGCIVRPVFVVFPARSNISTWCSRQSSSYGVKLGTGFMRRLWALSQAPPYLG